MTITFFHNNIIKFANRPFATVEEMNRSLIQNWNSVVGYDDIVWCLGDFAFAKVEKIKSILGQLNGIKHLVLGNHDQEIIKNRQNILDSGLYFHEIVPYKELYIGKQFVVLHHYAQRVWNKSHHGSYHLFGHTHGRLSPYGKSVDVGVDSTFITGKAEYRPFTFDEIKIFMDKQIQTEKYDD